MKELNEANAVLSDLEKRAAYDQLGRGYQPGQEFRPPPDWDAGFEFSGRGFCAGRGSRFLGLLRRTVRSHGAAVHAASTPGQRTHFQARGEDHHAKVLLDIEDAFHRRDPADLLAGAEDRRAGARDAGDTQR
jgi:curved DNA-binding protein